MPYITNDDKDQVELRGAGTPGELNYEITEVVLRYKHRKGLSYATINDVMGALEGAKQEFYRRVAVPYEEQKRFENGDVYE